MLEINAAANNNEIEAKNKKKLFTPLNTTRQLSGGEKEQENKKIHFML